jgi:hypothetical protein
MQWKDCWPAIPDEKRVSRYSFEGAAYDVFSTDGQSQPIMERGAKRACGLVRSLLVATGPK